MTTFAQLQTDVYSITGRPDRVSETQIGIRRATLKFHMADFWLQDLVKDAVVPVTPLFVSDFRYQIDTTQSPFLRFRRAQQVRQYLNPPTGTELYFDRVEANDLIDDYAIEKWNYWYQAGTSIQVRSDTGMTNIAVNYYRYPVVTADLNYSSWIADIFSDAITMEAAAEVFKAIGKDDEFQRMRAEYLDNLSLLRTMVTSRGE